MLLRFEQRNLEKHFRDAYHAQSKPVALAYSMFLQSMHLIMLVQHFKTTAVEKDHTSYTLYLLFRAASVLPFNLVCMRPGSWGYQPAMLWHRAIRLFSLVWAASRPAAASCNSTRNLLVDVAFGQLTTPLAMPSLFWEFCILQPLLTGICAMLTLQPQGFVANLFNVHAGQTEVCNTVKKGLSLVAGLLENSTIFVMPTHPPTINLRQSILTLALWWLLVAGFALPAALTHYFEATARLHFLQRHSAMQVVSEPNRIMLQRTKRCSVLALQVLQLTVAAVLPGYWLLYPLVHLFFATSV